MILEIQKSKNKYEYIEIKSQEDLIKKVEELEKLKINYMILTKIK